MMRVPFAGLLLLTLAACGKEAPPPPEQGPAGAARGQVLEGTISDAMLPLDTIVQPDPPPLAAAEEDEGTPADGAARPGRAQDAPADDTAERAPASAPAPEPDRSAPAQSDAPAAGDAD